MTRPMSVQEKHEEGRTYKHTNNIKYWKPAVLSNLIKKIMF